MLKKEIRKVFYISIALISVFSLSEKAFSDVEDELEFLYGDEETVSIATGTNKALRLAPSVASVITDEDIISMGAQTLDDVLESIPGLHVSFGARNSSLYSIRGIHTSYNPQVLMLVDGFPLTELFTGGRVSSFILPIRDIERVEVIRGPGSALYGADAFAGVINVITKKGVDNSNAEIGVNAGSFDTYEGWFNYSDEILGWKAFFSLDYMKSKGDDGRLIESDLQTTLDRVFFTDASLAPDSLSTHFENIVGRVNLSSENWYVSASFMEMRNGGLAQGVAEALDPKGSFNTNQQHVQLKFNDWFQDETLQFNLDLNFLRIEQENKYSLLPANTVVPIGSDGNINLIDPAGFVLFPDGLKGNPSGVDKNYSFETSVVYKGFDRHSIRVGTGYKIQKEDTRESKNFGPGIIDGTQAIVSGVLTDVTGQPYVYMDDQKRKIKYILVQDEWEFYTDWELTLGVRFDDYSDFGNTTNPRLAIVWETNYNLTSKFIYGRAFRAPSFSEQFAKNNPSLLGNLNIDPEVIDMYELSFDYRFNYNLKTQVNIFTYTIDGLINYIDSDGLAGGGSIAQNSLDQDGIGLEMEIVWKASSAIDVLANYSWQNSENKKTGDEIADAPQNLFYFDIQFNFLENWMITNQLSYVNGRNRAPGDDRDEIDNYFLVNINLLNKNLFKNTDLKLSVKNLFDEEAREPSAGPVAGIMNDYPLAGRSLVVEGVYRF